MSQTIEQALESALKLNVKDGGILLFSDEGAMRDVALASEELFDSMSEEEKKLVPNWMLVFAPDCEIKSLSAADLVDALSDWLPEGVTLQRDVSDTRFSLVVGYDRTKFRIEPVKDLCDEKTETFRIVAK